ncbi:MAG: DUF2541 family protein [Acidobacteria bacterium]|nr:DUF2541 family protein [Acidobacteriota bacterium]MCB9397317.1 DUF2541 family protein [Acidobacteriota bacterium]
MRFLGLLLLINGMVWAGDWEKLGERRVNYTADTDVISVGAREGRFSKIKLEVRRNGVDFRKVVVHFKNGDKQEIEVRDHIAAGGQTRVIDLDGNTRVIARVVFHYDTQGMHGKKALVILWGRD